MALLDQTQSAKSDSHRYAPKYRNGPPRPPSLPPYVKKWHMPTHGRYQHRRPYSSAGGSGGGAHGFPPGNYPAGLLIHGGTKHPVGGFIHPGATLQKQHQQQLLQTQYLPLQHKVLTNLPPITKPQPSKYEVTKPQPSNYEMTNPQASNYEMQRVPQRTNVWNTFKQLNPHIETAYSEPSQEKTPFASSPQINNLDYDNHIQTNNIPNNHLIEQMDDNSGPIHTIPAPNLSLADKPKNIGIEATYKDTEYQATYPKGNHKQRVKPATGHKYTHVTIQKAHQYQVTETAPPESNQKQLNGAHGTYIDFDSNLKQADQQVQYQQLETLPQAQFLVQQPPPDVGLHQQQQLPDQELLGVFNTVPQQPLVDVIALPLGHQHLSFEGAAAPLTNYHNVIGSSHVIQPDYMQFKTDMVGNMRPPDYHTFNYQESDHAQKRPQQGVDVIYHHPQQQSAQDSYQYGQQNQPLGNHHRQHQHYGGSEIRHSVPYNIDFVQQFFAQQENAAPPASQEYSQSKEDAIVGAFYSTLPNKEAADALASLQVAGKLNTDSHLHQRSASKSDTLKKAAPMTIYVPDDFDEPDDRRNSNISKKSIAKDQEYFENVSHDEDIFDGMTDNKEFGERIKRKQ